MCFLQMRFNLFFKVVSKNVGVWLVNGDLNFFYHGQLEESVQTRSALHNGDFYVSVLLPNRQVVSEAQEKAESLFRSEEHTSELQSLMRTSYAVFWLKQKK